ncbi:GNAT family N-acetyltransferase [Furfurilactobacillus siliginis]|uniref:N-acetyltransferase domain-containing protein n=1 Tax=Furfurilactobacillus siliginis TaxID=348151 RepID=A0A0R2LCQ8_9LACO|nr:GNAT family N-acetyltransferase [Furfurilactobacillus siliginis]KRN96413.1 hypothetical protein IV55_GL001381 [Furfurilactobacillus siliginis]GEK29524.1 hypothetical protein LSI01_18350 [Furfurilactobacillus siliginis]
MTFTLHTADAHDYDAEAKLIETTYQNDPDEMQIIKQQLLALRHERTYTEAFELVVKDQTNTIVGLGALSDSYILGQPTARIAILFPLLVAPDYANQGIGRQLIDELEHRAFVRGYQAVAITGSPDYLTRFGYQPALDFGITANPLATGICMLRELRPDALRHFSGKLVYPNALT